jgi:hypothetical protein
MDGRKERDEDKADGEILPEGNAACFLSALVQSRREQSGVHSFRMGDEAEHTIIEITT